MLRECIRLARVEQRVCIFVEPIALYMTRDLHQADDSGWTHTYLLPGAEPPISLGQVGVCMAMEKIWRSFPMPTAITVPARHKRSSQNTAPSMRGVVDLRWIAPLDYDAIAGAIGDCQKILMVDECRASGSVSEAILADFLLRYGGERAVGRITADGQFHRHRTRLRGNFAVARRHCRTSAQYIRSIDMRGKNASLRKQICGAKPPGKPAVPVRLEQDLTVDLAIVGGGFTGCSAALHGARPRSVGRTP